MQSGQANDTQGNHAMSYQDTQLLIDGNWCDPDDGRTLPVLNPSSGKEIGRVAHASKADLDRALAAAQRGFEVWRQTPAIERSKILRQAAVLLRERASAIALLMTLDQGLALLQLGGRRGSPVRHQIAI